MLKEALKEINWDEFEQRMLIISYLQRDEEAFYFSQFDNADAEIEWIDWSDYEEEDGSERDYALEFGDRVFTIGKETLENASLEELKSYYLLYRYGKKFLIDCDRICIDVRLENLCESTFKLYNSLTDETLCMMETYKIYKRKATKAEKKRAYDLFIKAAKEASK